MVYLFSLHWEVFLRTHKTNKAEVLVYMLVTRIQSEVLVSRLQSDHSLIEAAALFDCDWTLGTTLRLLWAE